MSDDELFGTRPRGAPAMGRRRGGERSTERASPALAADLADDSSAEETRPPASRSGGWAGEDAAGAPASSSGWAAGGPAEGVARDFDDDESPVRPSRAGGFGGTPGGSASRRRMDSASKHDALEARGAAPAGHALDGQLPGLRRRPGRLRLLYECNPMAFLVEQAGGKASDGFGRIMDIQPTALHQRTPYFVGSTRMVERAEAFMREFSAHEDPANQG